MTKVHRISVDSSGSGEVQRLVNILPVAKPLPPARVKLNPIAQTKAAEWLRANAAERKALPHAPLHAAGESSDPLIHPVRSVPQTIDWAADPFPLYGRLAEALEPCLGVCNQFIGLAFTIGVLTSFFHLNDFLNSGSDLADTCPQLSRVSYAIFVLTLSQIAQLISVAGMGLLYGLLQLCCGWRAAKFATTIVTACLLPAGALIVIGQSGVSYWALIQLSAIGKANDECYSASNSLWLVTIVLSSFYAAAMACALFSVCAKFCTGECKALHLRSVEQRRSTQISNELDLTRKAKIGRILVLSPGGGYSPTARQFAAYFHSVRSALTLSAPMRDVPLLPLTTDDSTSAAAALSHERFVANYAPPNAVSWGPRDFHPSEPVIRLPPNQPSFHRFIGGGGTQPALSPRATTTAVATSDSFAPLLPSGVELQPLFVPAAAAVPAATSDGATLITIRPASAPLRPSGATAVSGINRLGSDVTRLIFVCCGAAGVVNAIPRVCRLWYRIAASDGLWVRFWQSITASLPPPPPHVIPLAQLKAVVLRSIRYPAGGGYPVGVSLPEDAFSAPRVDAPARASPANGRMRHFLFTGWDVTRRSMKRFASHETRPHVCVVMIPLTTFFHPSTERGAKFIDSIKLLRQLTFRLTSASSGGRAGSGDVGRISCVVWLTGYTAFVNRYRTEASARARIESQFPGHRTSALTSWTVEAAQLMRQREGSAADAGSRLTDSEFWRLIPRSFVGFERTVTNAEFSDADRAINAIRLEALKIMDYDYAANPFSVWLSDGLNDEPNQHLNSAPATTSVTQSASPILGDEKQPPATASIVMPTAAGAAVVFDNSPPARLSRAVDPATAPLLRVGVTESLHGRISRLISLAEPAFSQNE